MNVTIDEKAAVSAYIYDPTSGKAFDPITGTLQPIDLVKSLVPFAPAAPQLVAGQTAPAGLFDGIKALDDRGALRSYPRAIVLAVTVDAAGNPIAPYGGPISNPYAASPTPYGPALSQS